MPLARVPHVALLPRIWQLRHNLSVYDAAYVALAEALGAPLLTADRTLAAVPGLRCEASCSLNPAGRGAAAGGGQRATARSASRTA